MRELRKQNQSREMSLSEAAEYCQMSPKTLRNYMAGRQGPRHIKRFGRLVFVAADLDAWIDYKTVTRKAFGR